MDCYFSILKLFKERYLYLSCSYKLFTSLVFYPSNIEHFSEEFQLCKQVSIFVPENASVELQFITLFHRRSSPEVLTAAIFKESFKEIIFASSEFSENKISLNLEVFSLIKQSRDEIN